MGRRGGLVGVVLNRFGHERDLQRGLTGNTWFRLGQLRWEPVRPWAVRPSGDILPVWRLLDHEGGRASSHLRGGELSGCAWMDGGDDLIHLRAPGFRSGKKGGGIGVGGFVSGCG